MKFFLAIVSISCLFWNSGRVFSATLAPKTTIEEHPYQVSLQVFHEGEMKHICGGSIVSDNCIVTAAHCKLENYEYQVVAGVTKLSQASQGQIAQIDEFIIHPKYNPAVLGTDDIGIIKLTHPFDLNQVTVKAIDLPAPDEDFVWSQVKVTGWGSTALGVNVLFPITTDDLRELSQTVVPTQLCNIISEADEKTDLCAQGIIGSACNGDSGGPLSKKNVLVGIVSRGFSPCAGTYNIYTKAAAYSTYIQEQCGML